MILGCPHGFNWTIVHEANKVIHIDKTGELAVMPPATLQN
jgi:hypothetical protein